MKKRRRKAAKAPRRCIFCGGGGVAGNPMSGEHIWSEWMHPYLPRLEDPKKATGYTIIRYDEVIVQRPKPQQGHPYTKTVRVVCKKCNETWMGDIEERVKPFLIPVLQGQPVLLDSAAQLHLANWIALKIMVVEHEEANDAVMRQRHRSAFMRRRTIPPEMRIWVAMHDEPLFYTGYWHRTFRGRLGKPIPPRSKFKNVQTTFLGVGHLYTLTFVSLIPEIKLDLRRGSDKVRAIWLPTGADINWPLPRISTDTGKAMAEVLSQLLRSRNTSFVRRQRED